MDTVKYELKFFLDDPSGVELEEFIRFFTTGFNQQLAELLIDVADTATSRMGRRRAGSPRRALCQWTWPRGGSDSYTPPA